MFKMYFCLLSDGTAKWYLESPSKEFETSPTWKRSYTYKKWGSQLTFESYLQVEPKIDFKSMPPSLIPNLSLVKSNLQKTFRRGETQICLSSFKTFCQLSVKSALKRLGIIILEDGFVTPACNTLLWYQICTTFFDYQVTESDLTFVSRLIEFQCETVKKRMWLDGMRDIDLSEITLDNVKQISDGVVRDMSLSLLLYNDKNSFKLAGDKILAKFSIYLLKQIPQSLLSEYDVAVGTSSSTLFSSIEPLNPSSLRIVACDFHVDPNLLDLIRTKCLKQFELELSRDYLKETIWYMSSRTNVRVEIDFGTGLEADVREREKHVQATFGELWTRIKEVCYRCMLDRLLVLRTQPTIYGK